MKNISEYINEEQIVEAISSDKYDIENYIGKIENVYCVTYTSTNIKFKSKTSTHRAYESYSINSGIEDSYGNGLYFNTEKDAINWIENELKEYPLGRPTEFERGTNLSYRLPNTYTVITETFTDLVRNVGRRYAGYGNNDVTRISKPFSVNIYSYGVTCLPTVKKPK